MSTAISSFRNKVISHVPGCPWPKIDETVLEAIRVFCEETYLIERAFEAEGIDYTTISAVDNDSITVTLSDHFTNYDPVAPVEFQIDGAPWHLQELYLYDDNSNLDMIAVDGTKFFNFPTLTTMKIFPFTGQAANFDLYIKLALKPTRLLTSVDDVFYNDWLDAIVFLTVGMLQSVPGREWTNLELAGFNLSRYNIQKGRAKLRRGMGLAKGNQAISGGYF